MKFSRYWLRDNADQGQVAGAIFDYGETSPDAFKAMRKRGAKEGFGVIEGEFPDSRFAIDLSTKEPVKTQTVIAPSAADVKIIARARIEARYPIWRQINILMEGGAPLAEMRRYIDAVRAASNKIERAIPSDFTSDHHWPA